MSEGSAAVSQSAQALQLQVASYQREKVQMSKPSAKSTISSPLGIKMPIWVYATMIGASITAGSAIVMTKLELPAWAWLLEFTVLTVVTFFVVKNNATSSVDSAYVVTNRQRLLVFASLMAILIIVAIVISL